jgi:hypothetical protein
MCVRGIIVFKERGQEEKAWKEFKCSDEEGRKALL